MIVQRDPLVTSRIMASVKSRDTEPERQLRSALYRRGLRFRLQAKGLPGRPDVVFPTARVAVFVDGDFWHGSGWKARGFRTLEEQFSGPRSDFWIAKIKGNIDRDAKVNAALKALGWAVVRVWETDVRRSPERCADRVLRVLRRRQASRG